jgi:hypothetical protein
VDRYFHSAGVSFMHKFAYQLWCCNHFPIIHCKSRGSIVGIATGCRLEDLGIGVRVPVW